MRVILVLLFELIGGNFEEKGHICVLWSSPIECSRCVLFDVRKAFWEKKY